MNMQNLINHIKQNDCRGIIRSADGALHYFMHPGVVDLYRLVTTSPSAVCGGVIADRVIGRGAALLLVKGKISQVYAMTMSTGARKVLCDAGVDVQCDNEVEYIINRTGSDICPVEKATSCTSNPDEALVLIESFLKSAGII